MVPVGEGRAKVVTPLSDIQLLQPVTATMLEKGETGKGGRGEGGRKREQGREGGRIEKEKKSSVNNTARRT